ncbi:hypothetical protein EYF80_063899 [Liparis tanakae]|uniref:Uncharacterized protein n=1 Tax=Liparis tanakae TaxID=230148 RepID=A0A4Z2EAV0_9TELE|nr:hypothetical protein EYF80_063899 [Liparis tanakae]
MCAQMWLAGAVGSSTTSESLRSWCYTSTIQTSTIHQADGGREEEWVESQQWAEPQRGRDVVAEAL